LAIVLVFVFAPGLMLLFIEPMVRPVDAWSTLQGLAACFAIAGGALGWWWTAPAAQLRSVTIGVDALVCPRNRHARRELHLPWKKISFAHTSAAARFGPVDWCQRSGPHPIQEAGLRRPEGHRADTEARSCSSGITHR
jgi:hypothetical protein